MPKIKYNGVDAGAFVCTIMSTHFKIKVFKVEGNGTGCIVGDWPLWGNCHHVIFLVKRNRRFVRTAAAGSSHPWEGKEMLSHWTQPDHAIGVYKECG